MKEGMVHLLVMMSHFLKWPITTIYNKSTDSPSKYSGAPGVWTPSTDRCRMKSFPKTVSSFNSKGTGTKGSWKEFMTRIWWWTMFFWMWFHFKWIHSSSLLSVNQSIKERYGGMKRGREKERMEVDLFVRWGRRKDGGMDGWIEDDDDNLESELQ